MLTMSECKQHSIKHKTHNFIIKYKALNRKSIYTWNQNHK